MRNLESYIRDVPDFPKPGILFKDITTLLKDKEGFKAAIDALYEKVKDIQVDKVIGIESRGFIFAPSWPTAWARGSCRSVSLENCPRRR